jgi:hypothetical protein
VQNLNCQATYYVNIIKRFIIRFLTNITLEAEIQRSIVFDDGLIAETGS